MQSRWLLLTLYVLVGGANIVRGVTGWAASPALVTKPIGLPFLSSVYLVWGGVFIAGAIAVGRRLAWSDRRRPMLAMALLYQASVWTIRVVGELSSYARSLWARDLMLSSAFVLLVIMLTRGPAGPKARGGHRLRDRDDWRSSDG